MQYRLTGFIRWAMYYEGQDHVVTTEQLDPKTKRPIKRVTKKNTVIYGDWCGATDVPLKKWEDHKAGCNKIEIHIKGDDGGIQKVYSEEAPHNTKIQYLAISPMNPNTDVGKKLPTYIEGIKVTSPRMGVKTFKVMEGV